VPDAPLHPSIQRVLDAAARKGVTLEVTIFDESTHTASEAAAAVGAELGQIVKSLVFVIPTDDRPEPVLCLVAGHNRVDIARLAAVASAPDIRRATAREAHDLTGFSIGGIPPIGHQRPVRTIMDPDLGRYPVVWAAAGLATAVFPVPPGTLRILSNATVAPIAEERTAADLEAAAAEAAGTAGNATGGTRPAGAPVKPQNAGA
jgi:prolyl-tRNA editing enzyme YbaK/EbsC (Cys-tRNA(Pro) deacylase)